MSDLYDAVVVGAGPAGLSAALSIARACRRVLVVDDDHARNAPAAQAWGFVTRDGTPPEEIRALGRAELARYDATFLDAHVESAVRTDDGFCLSLTDHDGDVQTRTLVLATGIADILPAVPGMHEAWGTGVAHCPYCHGWDLRGRPTAFYGTGHDAFEMGRFLTLWTDQMTVVADGPADLTPEQRAELDARGVAVDERPVGRIEQTNGEVSAVVFEDGERLCVGAVYVKPNVRPRSTLPETLGARLMPNRIVATDEVGRVENVPGLYLAGDVAEKQHQVVLAAASGTRVAFALNHDLVVRDTPEIAAP
ncbi:MAG TPA: NAD(P)/FAD-dependent oxidoreductase [Rubricoccaceae bacterium]|jgi:thioredoxin reductase